MEHARVRGRWGQGEHPGAGLGTAPQGYYGLKSPLKLWFCFSITRNFTLDSVIVLVLKMFTVLPSSSETCVQGMCYVNFLDLYTA